MQEPFGGWLEQVRDFIGDLWGRTTTIILAILVAAIPALNAIDAALLPIWARISIGMAGVVVAVLRVVAPPPAAVVMKKDDEVIIDKAEGTVTVIKPSPITQDIESKPAGEAPTAGEVTI
jgi:hypothetical protein